jgi:hypothetical protein
MVVLGGDSVPEHGVPRRSPSPGNPQGERCSHQVDAFLPHVDAIPNVECIRKLHLPPLSGAVVTCVECTHQVHDAIHTHDT